MEGKDKPPAVPSPTVPVGYDAELERKKFEFQMKQWEVEREERRHREEERRRWEFQVMKWDEEKKRAEGEKEERRRLEEEEKRRAEEEREERRRKEEDKMELRRQELDLRERELQAQLERDRERKSLADRAKRFGDALKGTIARMPADPVDLLSYFRDVEQQFDLFEVPADLRVEILRPHLSDKAKLLVSKMDPRHNTVYGEVKRMLLREFKLSPAVYLERFNTEIRKTDETYLLYSARLRSILDAYTDSRMLTRHPERIPELLVSDRIKSTLPVACLNYVLSVEATKDEGWLSPHDLAETIDKYFANRGPQGDRPKAGAIGMSTPVAKLYGPVPSGPSMSSGRFSRPGSGSPPRKSEGSNEQRTPVSTTDKRCFKCGSVSHLYRECPQRGTVRQRTPSMLLGVKPK